mmetsp:Transcript_16814/g.38553  ORF Transcript_16814/g.38553 Transcript_16814/m.38553 type:complete len:231 (-) Transcript_16814:152-844(-)
MICSPASSLSTVAERGLPLPPPPPPRFFSPEGCGRGRTSFTRTAPSASSDGSREHPIWASASASSHFAPPSVLYLRPRMRTRPSSGAGACSAASPTRPLDAAFRHATTEGTGAQHSTGTPSSADHTATRIRSHPKSMPMAMISCCDDSGSSAAVPLGWWYAACTNAGSEVGSGSGGCVRAGCIKGPPPAALAKATAMGGMCVAAEGRLGDAAQLRRHSWRRHRFSSTHSH